MADSEKPKTGPPESPTTARELDFDDDDVPASPKLPKSASGAAGVPKSRQIESNEDAPPPQPARPQNPKEQAESTLREAFPSIDAAVVKAVLVASGWQVEPAFNALLGMSDPDAQQEPLPPPQPPRPTQNPRGLVGRSQLEADELYARQLAEHYNNQANYQGPRRDASRDYRGQDPRLSAQPRESGLKPNELYDDREHNFIDDDLPVIRENLRKGFLETQSKVNSFLSNLKKKIDGEDEEEEPPPQPPRRGNYPQQYGGRRSGEMGRRSGDRERYDADPQVLGDDFASIHLQDDTTPQRRTIRPLANPDLFKPTPTPPQSDRKVSFQSPMPDDTGGLYRSSPDPTKRPSSTGGRSKWQPLASVDPDPVADHDPFSLGDSDDEDAKKKDIKPEDTGRLKKATAEAMAESIGTDGKKTLEPSETTGSSGTRDKVAEEKLARGL